MIAAANLSNAKCISSRLSKRMRSLLHGQETDAFGDAGYQGVDKRPDARSNSKQRGRVPLFLTLYVKSVRKKKRPQARKILEAFCPSNRLSYERERL